MNIQDMQYITAIAEAGSIGRAANKLLVAQPSLSKCIQKVEREYGITLFKRVKGVSVKLTPEGELFLGMAREMLLSHARFQEQLRRLKEVQNNSLVLGLTYQRTVDLAGAILHWLLVTPISSMVIPFFRSSSSAIVRLALPGELTAKRSPARSSRRRTG